MAAQQDNPKLTITLTDARPVTIIKDQWLVLASASDKYWDNQYEFQANRTSTWRLTVRQHADGRSIVYGVYSFDSALQGEANRTERAGELLAPEGDVIGAINRVAETIAGRLDADGNDTYNRETDADTMRRMARECIADLPPVDL